MIGGGELAFTLLGVHFNDQTGDLRFLIMDPHYTGPDDVSQIHSGKWIGWKKADSLTHLSTKLFDARTRTTSACLSGSPGSDAYAQAAIALQL